MKLTLDGLLRALRAKAHALADEIEAGYLVSDTAMRNDVSARGSRERQDDVGRA